MIFVEIVFWICFGALFHSYVLYPAILLLISKFKKAEKHQSYSNNDELPIISILMAAYNEELVIEKKIASIFETTYPIEKIELLVGSDNSTDQTNDLLKKLESDFNALETFLFDERHGKIKIINQLSEKAKGEILIITDANVLFEKETLFQLIRFFKDPSIGLVDSSMQNYNIKKDGISFQEKSYISREVWIKHLESITGKCMVGPFGGCYAVDKKSFCKVPENYLVDDFYICMKVIEQGKGCINNLHAKVYEDVSNVLSIEFKRKTRIAIGNFQNLFEFRKLLTRINKWVAFNFFSHKVLRWLGPFWLLGLLISNLIIFKVSFVYAFALWVQLTVTILPILDIILKKIGIHIVPLRFATYFYSVNFSLFVGLIKYFKGVESNVWRPTKRFQG